MTAEIQALSVGMAPVSTTAPPPSVRSGIRRAARRHPASRREPCSPQFVDDELRPRDLQSRVVEVRPTPQEEQKNVCPRTDGRLHLRWTAEDPLLSRVSRTELYRPGQFGSAVEGDLAREEVVDNLCDARRCDLWCELRWATDRELGIPPLPPRALDGASRTRLGPVHDRTSSRDKRDGRPIPRH